MKRKKIDVWTWVILILAAWGLLVLLISNPYDMLLPVTVLGVILLLYWWNPGRRSSRSKTAGRTSSASPNAAKQPAAAKARSRKNMPFRVIEGGKDEDGMPKYH